MGGKEISQADSQYFEHFTFHLNLLVCGDYPEDNFEKGIPLFDSSETPKDIFLDIIDINEYNKSNKELSKDLQKSIEEVKEIQAENQNQPVQEQPEPQPLSPEPSLRMEHC